MKTRLGLTAAVLALGLSAPTSARADAADAPRGSITILGNGEASAAPEYMSLTVTVTSICYDSSRAAEAANAALATKVVSALRKYATGTRDKVTASGGPNARESETIQVGSEWKTLCTSKWKASNTLTIEAAKISEVPAVQDDVLAEVDAAAELDPAQVAQTYADLAAPSFHVYPETQTRLRAEAQVKAYDDAEVQLATFKSVCAFKNPELVKIAPPEYTIVARSNGNALSAASPTPIIPDELAIDASLNFEWSFEPTPDCSGATVAGH